MSENSSSFTKRLIIFGLAVLLAAWSITTAVNLIASVWWQLLIIVAVILAAAVVIITLWNRRH